jgi:hypothetical protein
MGDATIEAIFDQAAALNADGKKEISAPGAAGLVVLLDSSSFSFSLNDIEGVYDQRGWAANHSLSLEDFQNCLQFLRVGLIYQLQSYFDIKYTEFRRSAPADPKISEKVRRSQFAHEHFHSLRVEYYLDMRNRQLCNRVAGGLLLPVMRIASIGDQASMSAAQETVSEMSEGHIPSFDAKLWSRWTEDESLKLYASIRKDGLFINLARAVYFSLIKECVEEEKTKCMQTFKPSCDVGINNATFDVQKERQQVIAAADAEDLVEVQKQLVAGWQEEIRKGPVAIKQYIDEDKMVQGYNEEKCL